MLFGRIALRIGFSNVGIPGKIVTIDGIRIGAKKFNHQNIPDPVGERCDSLKTLEQLLQVIANLKKER